MSVVDQRLSGSQSCYAVLPVLLSLQYKPLLLRARVAWPREGGGGLESCAAEAQGVRDLMPACVHVDGILPSAYVCSCPAASPPMT